MSGKRLACSLVLSAAVSIAVSMAPAAAANKSSGAAAHTLRTRSSHRATTNASLYYHGGPIEAMPVVYIDYWGSAWHNGFSTGGYTSGQAQTYVNDFFGGVGGTGWIRTQNQYCQSNGSVTVAVGATSCPSAATFVSNMASELAGTWNDTGSNPPRRPSQSNIASEALAAVAHFGYNANATYMIYLPSGSDPRGFGTSWCAWHSATSSNGRPVAYANIPYQPDAGTSCGMNFVNATDNAFGNGYFDGFSVVGGHEYAEAESDPRASTSSAGGWVDSSGNETGDKCAWSPSSGNISIGGHQFAVQPLWSNSAGGCVMS